MAARVGLTCLVVGFLGGCLVFWWLGGVLLVPVAVALLVLLDVAPDHRVGWGVLALSLLPATVFVSWANWDGPGYACHTVPGGWWCSSALSPWPFVTVSLILVMVGPLLWWRGLTSPRRCWLAGPADVT